VKFIFDNWLLALSALTSGVLLLAPNLLRQAKAGAGGSVSSAGAVQLINREKAVLLDVCEPDEFAKGHATNAKNLPFGQLTEKIASLVKHKDLPVLLMCQTGSRSSKAASLLKKAGYTKAQSVEGGLAAWRKDNLPVSKAST
jgi:rhodanese-related sulfurtransferase